VQSIRSAQFVSEEEAISILKRGELVILPTETVYGLAADALSHIAVKSVFDAKTRPYTNPLIVHYCSIDQVNEDAIFQGYARELAMKLWPGPLTLVLPRKVNANSSSIASANLPSIAARIPDHSITLEIIRKFGNPIVMPSANKYQCISPTNAYDATNSMPGISTVDGGYTRHGIESTIVDCTGNEPVILRHGAVSPNSINKVLNSEVYYTKDNRYKAPGSGLKHYCITKPIRLNADSVLPGESLLAFGMHDIQADICFNLSYNGSLQEAGRKLFYLLNKLDKMPNCSAIAVMPIPNVDIGIAINDKLEKASMVDKVI
jgi:L-threonylcarbamoyladenylate synthase